MKVLHVDTGREMRGGQHQVLLLMNGLRSAGHQCILLARRSSPLASSASSAGFTVHSATARELWRQSRDVNVVHAHDSRAHTLSAVAAQQPFVVSRRVGFAPQKTLLSRMKYRRAARYLAISQFVAGRLCKAGISADRVDVVFDAVEVPGPLSEWHLERPVVAPGFRDDPKKLSQLTQDACQSAGVKLVLSSDLMADLPRASLFVYLTASEGLGSAALLAMAAGVPVIASRVEGLAEVFEDGVSGLYVDNVASEITAAIRRVLDQSGLACALREAAYVRVQERFSTVRLIEATLCSYQRAIAA